MRKLAQSSGVGGPKDAQPETVGCPLLAREDFRCGAPKSAALKGKRTFRAGRGAQNQDARRSNPTIPGRMSADWLLAVRICVSSAAQVGLSVDDGNEQGGKYDFRYAPQISVAIGVQRTLGVARVKSCPRLNIRAGRMPPPDANGVCYLKIPVKLET